MGGQWRGDMPAGPGLLEGTARLLIGDLCEGWRMEVVTVVTCWPAMVMVVVVVGWCMDAAAVVTGDCTTAGKMPTLAQSPVTTELSTVDGKCPTV